MSSSTNFAILLAVTMCGTILCQDFILGTCRQPPVQKSFDLQKFAGKWYEIQRYQGLFNFVSNVRCASVNYTVVSNYEVLVNNSYSTTLLSIPIATTKTAKINDQSVPAKWDIFLDPNLNQNVYGNDTSRWERYWILETDHTQYALVYSCFGNNQVSIQNAFILSRSDVLSNSILQGIRSRVKSYNLWDYYFRNVDQANCKY